MDEQASKGQLAWRRVLHGFGVGFGLKGQELHGRLTRSTVTSTMRRAAHPSGCAGVVLALVVRH